MKLVRLTGADRRPIWINPAHVAYITPDSHDGNDWTGIYFAIPAGETGIIGPTYERVRQSAPIVASALADEIDVCADPTPTLAVVPDGR